MTAVRPHYRMFPFGELRLSELTGIPVCPCCGGTPEMWYLEDREWIECRECGLSTDVVPRGEARQLWSRRV